MPTFQTVWSNHSNIKGDTPLLDQKVYANQCAINMSAALIRSGISLKGFRGALSWQKGQPKYATVEWFAVDTLGIVGTDTCAPRIGWY